MEKVVTEKQAMSALKGNYNQAEQLLNQPDQLEKLLQDVENKLKEIPRVGDTLAMVPLMISMVRSYLSKEYNEIPSGTMIAIVAALLYIFSPLDIIPDFIPGVGYIDDALVVAVCIKFVQCDLDRYKEWRKKMAKR